MKVQKRPNLQVCADVTVVILQQQNCCAIIYDSMQMLHPVQFVVDGFSWGSSIRPVTANEPHFWRLDGQREQLQSSPPIRFVHFLFLSPNKSDTTKSCTQRFCFSLVKKKKNRASCYHRCSMWICTTWSSPFIRVVLLKESAGQRRSVSLFFCCAGLLWVTGQQQHCMWISNIAENVVYGIQN